ncbi:hypothetical protein EDD22DRAFT_982197 [Suillus occidentalis]|nr:hypothetical protein EDD22DRAFT_982197 [Suillus occidentalis]
MTVNCPNCLKDFKSAWAHATPGSSPHYRTSSPVQDFQMDFEVQADRSVEEPLGSQASEKPYIECFRNAAKVYWRGRTFQDRFNMDPYTAYRKDNLYYPFASRQDWELSSFLLCSSLSMAAIDEFLGLELVKAISLSFRTAKELRGRAELLPPVPKWQYCIVSTTHPTKQPLHLYWRDPLDCIESLFSHPFFANEMDVTLQRVYDTVERTSRIYNEWLMGDAAWSMQSQLPDGATLLGVILSSDKTNITNMTGGRASSCAFLLTALLPIAEFLHPVKRMQSVLEARLVHQCLDIVLEPLKQAAHIGRMMSDPFGNLRYCFTPLASFRALFVTPSIGVAQPFWGDWPLADPHFYDHDVKWCLAAVGEQELDFHFSILQPLTTFRHFKDGISNLKQVTGRAQCDMKRYIVALIADTAPRKVVIAVCTLMNFRYLSQATTIDEAHCQKILDALKEFHEHKQGIIACSARRGAKSKQVLNNWHIPKLELMQSVEPSICQVGSLLQWSADTTEHAHITLIKDPADSSNNINYDAQICRFLDHQEKCQNFHITTSIIARSQSQSQASTSQTTDAVLDDLRGPKRVVTDFFKKAKQVSSDIQVARPLCTFVVGATAIHLNFNPSIRRIPVNVVAEKFSLPDLRGALADYIQQEGMAQNFHSLRGQHRALPDAPLPFNDLMVWFKVRVQQASYHSPSITLPALTVNASPLSTTWKYGHYDAAIFAVDDTGCEQWPTSGLKGHDVVEVHLIMQPLPPRGKTGTSAPWGTRFLTYVQRLDVMPQRHGSLLESTTQMHILKCAMRSAGTPFGDILPLDQLCSFAHIIPRFGCAADSRLTAQNSTHFAQTFFLNKYIDKDFYYAISN